MNIISVFQIRNRRLHDSAESRSLGKAHPGFKIRLYLLLDLLEDNFPGCLESESGNLGIKSTLALGEAPPWVVRCRSLIWRQNSLIVRTQGVKSHWAQFGS